MNGTNHTKPFTPALRKFARTVALLTFGLMAVPSDLAAQKASPFAKDALLTGYIEYSPIQIFDSDALEDPTEKSFVFGKPLQILAQTKKAVQVQTDDGPVWMRRSDVFMTDTPKTVVTTSLFKERERQSLRFFESLSTMRAFFGHERGAVVSADYAEFLFQKPEFKLRMPVMATEVVEAVGRPIQVASVLVPVRAETVASYDALRGATDTQHHIAFVVDISGDTLDFSGNAMRILEKNLRGRLAGLSGDVSYSLTTFAMRDAPKITYEPEVKLGYIGASVDAFETGPGPSKEPLLAAVHQAVQDLDEDASSNLVVILSGADVLAKDKNADGVPISLEDPGLDLPENVEFLIGQVGPDLGEGLKEFSQAELGGRTTTYFEYSDKLVGQMARAIEVVMNPNDERVLKEEDLTDTCKIANELKTICMLPEDLSTASRMPGQHGRAKLAEWYTSTFWIVVDGDLLKFGKVD